MFPGLGVTRRSSPSSAMADCTAATRRAYSSGSKNTSLGGGHGGCGPVAGGEAEARIRRAPGSVSCRALGLPVGVDVGVHRLGPVAGVGGRIARGIPRAGAFREHPHHGVVIGAEEHREGVARGARRVDYPMGSGHEEVVGPALHHVPDVHDEGSRDRHRLDPLAGSVLHLQPRRVLPQDGEALVVGVGAHAERRGIVHPRVPPRDSGSGGAA